MRTASLTFRKEFIMYNFTKEKVQFDVNKQLDIEELGAFFRS